MRRLLARALGPARGSVRAPAVDAKPADYARWVAAHDQFDTAAATRLRGLLDAQPDRPSISVLLLGGTAADAAMLADQVLPAREVIALADQPGALGAALREARGDFVTVIEAGDRLAPAALAAAVLALAGAPAAIGAYTDEDRLDAAGQRVEPWFKDAWSPTLLLGQAYPLRLGLLRRDHALGVVLPGTPPPLAAWYGLWLAAADAGAEVLHLPFVLLHRAARAPRDEPVAFATLLAARTGTTATVGTLPTGGWRHVAWALPAAPPRISALIPTRDRLALLRGCVEGLRHGTDWPDLEIIIVDNGSEAAATRDYLASLAADPRVRVLRDDAPFNFSRLNNLAAAAASGPLLALLNNDLAMPEPGWLRAMVAEALRPGVGAVGARLHYGDGAVQHAGVVLGLGGVASHLHKRLPAGALGYQGRVVLTRDVGGVTGACMLTPRAVYRELGGMNEADLPIAYNDVDYCLRVRASGRRIVYAAAAQLAHLESASRGVDDDGGARRARLERDKAWMRARWGAALDADPFYSPNLSLKATDCRLAFPPRCSPPWQAQPAEPSPRKDPAAMPTLEDWDRSEPLRTRRYASYDQYLEHQAAKLKRLKLEDYSARFRAVLHARLVDLAPLRARGRGAGVLCLGARNGVECEVFIALGAFALGVDLNPGEANRHVVHGDFHALQFADASVGVVFTNALDHAFDLDRILAEVRRVLVPGGLFIAEIVRGSRDERGREPGDFESLWWDHAEEVAAAIRRAGFDEMQRTGFEYPWQGDQCIFVPAPGAVPSGTSARPGADQQGF